MPVHRATTSPQFKSFLDMEGKNLTLKGCSLLLNHFHRQANFPGRHAKTLSVSKSGASCLLTLRDWESTQEDLTALRQYRRFSKTENIHETPRNPLSSLSTFICNSFIHRAEFETSHIYETISPERALRGLPHASTPVSVTPVQFHVDHWRIPSLD